jgi:pilus assembly protein CpaC
VRALFPKEDVRLSQANGSVVISGNVDPSVAKQVETVIQAAGFATVNMMVQPVQAMHQVQLQVRVAEVSRNKLQELAAAPVVQTQPGQGGYTNTGQGPWTLGNVDAGSMFGSVANSLNLFVMSNNAFMFLRALQTQGALRALAEPNLIAMNGQQASFLAGGELPIPIAQSSGGNNNNTVTIQWKEYGIRVNFKPTILDEQHIRLELEPEVSTLDYNNAIRFNGFLIPALRTRRAKTGIELQDGQSFGIAGLLDNSETKSLSKIPILGDVPVIGNLFKSKAFQKAETELVFIVTAKITKPLNPDALPQMRGVDGLKNGSPLGVETPVAASGGGSSSGNGAPADNGAASGIGAAPAADGAPASDAAPDPEPAKKELEVAPAAKEPEQMRESGGKHVETAPQEASPAGESAPKGPAPAPAGTVSKPVAERTIDELIWKIRFPEGQILTAQRGVAKIR